MKILLIREELIPSDTLIGASNREKILHLSIKECKNLVKEWRK